MLLTLINAAKTHVKKALIKALTKEQVELKKDPLYNKNKTLLNIAENLNSSLKGKKETFEDWELSSLAKNESYHGASIMYNKNLNIIAIIFALNINGHTIYMAVSSNKELEDSLNEIIKFKNEPLNSNDWKSLLVHGNLNYYSGHSSRICTLIGLLSLVTEDRDLRFDINETLKHELDQRGRNLNLGRIKNIHKDLNLKKLLTEVYKRGMVSFAFKYISKNQLILYRSAVFKSIYTYCEDQLKK